MSFWNKEHKREPEALPSLSPWNQAKLIAAEDAQLSALPPGWYVYSEDHLWYGIRPRQNSSGLIRSLASRDPKELEPWLGIPLPEIPPDLLNTAPKQTLEEQVRMIQEQQRAERLRQQEALRHREDPIRKRKHRLYVRMTEEEYQDLATALKTSGMTQQTYILEAVKNYSSREFQEEALQLMGDISLELTCQGKLLREVLKGAPQYQLTDPDGWNRLLEVLKDREEMKRSFRKLMEGNHGHH